MKDKNFIRVLVSLFKLLVLFTNYMIFMIVFRRINYALLTPTRTFVITSAAYIFSIIMGSSIYGNFNIGYEKTKPVFLSAMIVALIANIVGAGAMAVMGIIQFPLKVVWWPILVSLVLTYALQSIVIWFGAEIGNQFYFKLYKPSNTIIINNNERIYCKINSYVISHDKQYKLINHYENVVDINSIDFTDVQHVFLLNYDKNFEKEIIQKCYYNDIYLSFNANTSTILTSKQNTYPIDDVLMIDVFPFNMTLTQMFIKRIIDIIGSLIILLITLPISLIVALMIKLDDGGPIFFLQERLTINGKIFKIVKFRSMKLNSGDRPTFEGDDRITKVGHIIRKLRLDELPQMVNILKGDMSLVGPRPESKAHSKVIKKEVPEFDQRLKVKAGLTGYAQIFGKYNTSPKMKLRLDIKYIESFSILEDIKLILQTLIVFVKPDSTEAFDANDN